MGMTSPLEKSSLHSSKKVDTGEERSSSPITSTTTKESESESGKVAEALESTKEKENTSCSTACSMDEVKDKIKAEDDVTKEETEAATTTENSPSSTKNRVPETNEAATALLMMK